MKVKPVVLFLLGILLLTSACATRTTQGPETPLPPIGPPTAVSQPTPPPQVTAPPPMTAGPQPTVALPDELTEWPVMTAIGTLEDGTPFGTTGRGNYFKGNPDAEVVILEFSEFQCPYCAQHVRETLPQIAENHIATGQVAYIYYNFPLPNHSEAMIAAEAAACAGLQDKFWEMHDMLFINQSEWSGNPQALEVFIGYAEKLALDGAAFQACMAEHQTQQGIEEDRSFGQLIGVPATPAFLVRAKGNEQPFPIVGAYPYEQFRQAIEAVSGGAP